MTGTRDGFGVSPYGAAFDETISRMYECRMERPIIGVLALVVGMVSSYGSVRAAVGVPVKCEPQPRYAGLGVPHLKRRYVLARRDLLKMHYTPVRLNNPSPICASHDCLKIRILPEAACAVDAPVCDMFWRTPDKRILKISTCGDEFGGEIDSVDWAKPSDIRVLLTK